MSHILIDINSYLLLIISRLKDLISFRVNYPLHHLAEMFGAKNDFAADR